MRHRIISISLACIFIMMANMAMAATTVVKNIRFSNDSQRTRVVFDLSKSVKYNTFKLARPERIVVDIANAKLGIDTAKLNLSKTNIKRIRVSKKGNDLRFVFDMKMVSTPTSFTLGPNKKYASRLVVDLSGSSSQLATSTPTPKITLNQPSSKLRDIVVVIDPGHGGKDPGATGRRGTREKKVVLAIAKALQRDLNSVPGYRAVLTRSKDVYIPLRRRTGIARDYSGDVFVSIHADAFKNSRARGASVFALSERGASSEAARWLAAKENHSELGGVDLDNKSNVLRSVLLDLSQTATVAASLRLGELVLAQMGKFAILHGKRVGQAGFVVLKSPDIPSILVETGFISNPGEENKLRSTAYQRKMAGAISRGIRNYFWQRAPEGTLIYAQRSKKGLRYKVARGDTLSEIAAKFGVSVTALRQVNNLKSNNIVVGKTLMIPAKA